MAPAEYYTHPFMVQEDRRGAYSSYTAPCLLKVSGGSTCSITVKIGRTVKAVDEAVEGPLFASTYSTEYLDKLVEKVHKQSPLHGEGLPCIVNWAIAKHWNREYIAYIIYTKLSGQTPWVIASLTNKPYTRNGRRVGFLAIVPADAGITIESCRVDGGELEFTISWW